MALMPVAEALARVLAGTEPLPAQAMPLADAHGHVLAEDLAALRTQPPADVSAMDGYAVRATDVAKVPVRLKIIGEVAAGHPFEGKVGAGEAARIFTGGVLPSGTDTIVIQEHTTREGDAVICPWHGSRFDLCSGAVEGGPAVYPQPRYETRERAGKVEIRAAQD